MDSINEKADFRIDRDGQWYHDGAPIKRDRLAKLFADRALKVDEDGNYWLQTPFEKYPVEVEDVPFIIIGYENRDNTITFRTNMDEEVTLDKNSEWELRGGIPYIEIRDGLFARINRATYYNLIEEFGADILGFPLGEVNDASGEGE